MSNIEVHSSKPATPGKKPVITPLEAIEEHCSRCSIDELGNVCDCFAESCHLWPFRFGTISGGAA